MVRRPARWHQLQKFLCNPVARIPVDVYVPGSLLGHDFDSFCTRVRLFSRAELPHLATPGVLVPSVSRAIVRAVLTSVIGLLSVVLALTGLTLPATAAPQAAVGAAAPRVAQLKMPTPAVAAKPSAQLGSAKAGSVGNFV